MIMSGKPKPLLRDLKWALDLNEFSLKLMGVWPNERDATKEPPSVRLRVPAMIAAVLVCLLLPQASALALVIHELPLVIDNVMFSCAILAPCLKLYFIWRNKRALWPVIESVRRDWLRQSKYSAWELAAMRREAARARLFTICGYAMVAGIYAGFALAPLLGINIRMANNITDYGDRLLMVQSRLPYDYSKSPSYEITQSSQVIAGTFVGMAVAIPDNYFAALVFHVSAQFEILGARIERFAAANPHQSSAGHHEDLRDCSVGALVDRHVHLIAMVTAIEQSFRYVLAAQVFAVTSIICCLGFEIIGIISDGSSRPSPIQVTTLVGTLLTWMLIFLVNCFASETLAFRSSNLFHNIYNCGWYGMHHQDTRVFVFMMLLSKTPRKLTAAKIIDLTLLTYCKILKSTAGYVSMLIAVNGK